MNLNRRFFCWLSQSRLGKQVKGSRERKTNGGLKNLLIPPIQEGEFGDALEFFVIAGYEWKL